ncbi:MAG: energy transducer TonB, partial [Chitinophagales bacterium]
KSIAMTNKEILHADLLDILFENRNKAYGAYALRKTYNYRLKWALGISLSSILLLLIFNYSRSEHPGYPVENGKWVKVSAVDFSNNKPKTPDLPKPKIKPPVAQTAYTSRIQIVDNNQKTDMPDKTEIDTSLISGKTIQGVRQGNIVEADVEPAEENGTGKMSNNDDKPFYSTSSDAQFPGGREAFTKFLTRYLITPGDLEAGEKRTVLVRFMVDIDGTISKTEIIQSDGEQYSKEVLRVLEKMPKWIPAMQNGNKTAVWFTQPVTFIGVEQ